VRNESALRKAKVPCSSGIPLCCEVLENAGIGGLTVPFLVFCDASILPAHPADETLGHSVLVREAGSTAPNRARKKQPPQLTALSQNCRSIEWWPVAILVLS
jgi:hypothetical protein